MKKFMIFLLAFCLIGCTSKPKEEVKEEETIQEVQEEIEVKEEEKEEEVIVDEVVENPDQEVSNEPAPTPAPAPQLAPAPAPAPVPPIAHTHTWNSGQVRELATCKNGGKIEYKCTGCGELKYEETPAADHYFTKHVNIMDARQVWYECTFCKMTIWEDQMDPNDPRIH